MAKYIDLDILINGTEEEKNAWEAKQIDLALREAASPSFKARTFTVMPLFLTDKEHFSSIYPVTPIDTANSLTSIPQQMLFYRRLARELSDFDTNKQLPELIESDGLSAAASLALTSGSEIEQYKEEARVAIAKSLKRRMGFEQDG